MRRVVLGTALVLVLAPDAWANAPVARDTAEVPHVGSWSVGVLNPLRFVPIANVELRLHPLVFGLAPHTSARVSHWREGAWTLSGDYGLWMPWLATKALQGHLFPSYDRGGGRLGFALVPTVGGLLSHNNGTRTLTGKLDVAFRLPVSKSDLRPLEAPALLELVFAPLLAGYRIRAGALWDARVSLRWRARAYGDVFLHGVDSDRQARFADHVSVRAGAGADVALTSRWRLALGTVVWNAQQFAVNSNGQRRRSTDILPVIDLLYVVP